MALHQTRFLYADRGPTSVYKFQVGDDPAIYVWFGSADGSGSLYLTPKPGPFRADEPLAEAPFRDLDALLAERGTTKAQWVEDLFGQYGDRVEWSYP
jgi:hypothetical protein